MLGGHDLARDARVIVEKPFCADLASAKALNRTINGIFDESAVFRIDHFLGKESVDNLLAFRFGNGLFEPIWNREHVAYVQIDVPETLSIEGYSEELGVRAGSLTETLFAMAVEVDNWRWRGVPFLLRSGKCMAESRQMITLGFHQPTPRMFDLDAMLGNQSLFTRADGIERLWEISAPLLEAPPRSSPTPGDRGVQTRSSTSPRRTAGTSVDPRPRASRDRVGQRCQRITRKGPHGNKYLVYRSDRGSR